MKKENEENEKIVNWIEYLNAEKWIRDKLTENENFMFNELIKFRKNQAQKEMANEINQAVSKCEDESEELKAIARIINSK